MAILKFLCETSDFDVMEASLDTNPTYVDTTRVANGFAFNAARGLMASWPEPAGNSIWLHWVHGQTSTSSNWDDFHIPEFRDIDGNLVFRIDLVNGLVQTVLYGDSTTVNSFGAVAGAQRVWDINIVKNGTTDLTMNFYVNGTQVITNATVTNAVNFGLPTNFNTQHGDLNAQGTQVFSEGIIADEDTRGWRLRQHLPSAYGAFDEWDGSANVPANDFRKNTGISTNTNDDRVSFTLTNLANLPSGVTIDRVCIQSTLIRGSTGLANFNHFWRYNSGPTVIHDSDIAVGLNPSEYISEYPTSPNTGVAWTDTEMQDIQVGVRGRT